MVDRKWSTLLLTLCALLCGVHRRRGYLREKESLGEGVELKVDSIIFIKTKMMDSTHDLEGDYDDSIPETQSMSNSQGGLEADILTECGRAQVQRSGRGKAPPKARSPNWTETECLLLIDEKRIEFEGRHHPDNPPSSQDKFIYGKDAWRKIEGNLNAVVGFRPRDQTAITNKWDALLKNYKHMKEYLGSSGAGEWWGLSKEQKKEVSRVRKLPLEFTQAMYVACEPWVGRRMIFSTTMNLQDSDRRVPLVPNRFGRAPSPVPRRVPHEFLPHTSSPSTLPEPTAGAVAPSLPASPTTGITTPSSLGDGVVGSSGRKRRQCGSDNLVDFVKDFNHDYLARVEVQEMRRNCIVIISMHLKKNVRQGSLPRRQVTSIWSVNSMTSRCKRRQAWFK